MSDQTPWWRKVDLSKWSAVIISLGAVAFTGLSYERTYHEKHDFRVIVVRVSRVTQGTLTARVILENAGNRVETLYAADFVAGPQRLLLRSRVEPLIVRPGDAFQFMMSTDVSKPLPREPGNKTTIRADFVTVDSRSGHRSGIEGLVTHYVTIGTLPLDRRSVPKDGSYYDLDNAAMGISNLYDPSR